jgi:hypothetical protein
MERLGLEAGTTAIGVTFSVARSVAVALLAGQLTQRELDPAWLTDHRADIDALAARVRVRHDWDATLATLRGAAGGGASLRDVGARGLLRTARRARALGMDEASPGRDALAELARRPALLRELGRIARGSGGPVGIDGLDTAALRMTFPCRLEVRLRSGRTIAAEGREPGAAGDALDRQHAVVAARETAVAES